MRALLPLLTIALLTQEAEPNLDAEYLQMFSGTYQRVVTIVVTHRDGRPYRGTVQCEGYWFKFADEDDTLSGWALPFRADSRGAIVMNPRKDDAPFSCWASGREGERVLVDFERPDNVYALELK